MGNLVSPQSERDPLKRSTICLGLLSILFINSAIASTNQSSWAIHTLPGYAGNLPFQLETGYVGVGDMEEVQYFYYFLESERDPQKDPLFLWLTGGPGCSALSGLMFEIGPITFNNPNMLEEDALTLQLNPYSWTKVANIIFLDSPVGTGYSYSTTAPGYYSTTSLSTHRMYDFLQKWMLSHPQFQENELYIAGDSYSGLPVPMIVELIVNGNEMGHQPHMNIQGYVLGNPYTNGNSDFNSRLKYAHRVSLVSDKLYESAVLNCDGKYVNADPNNAECQKALIAIDDCVFRVIYMPHILEPDCANASPKPGSILKYDPIHIASEEINLLHQRRRLNLRDEHPEFWCRSYNYLPIYVWTNDKRVQAALHVREGSIKEWVRCNYTLSGFTMDVNNTVPYHKRLTAKSLRALVYNGDQDLCFPYVGTLEWIKSLQLPVTSPWTPWFVDGQVAGYTTKYSNLRYRLTYTTIKGAGHTAPEYKPKEALSMIDRWLSRYPL